MLKLWRFDCYFAPIWSLSILKAVPSYHGSVKIEFQVELHFDAFSNKMKFIDRNTNLVRNFWSCSPSGLTRAELRDLKLRVLNDSLNFCDSLPKLRDPPRENLDDFVSMVFSMLLLLLTVN